MTTSLRVPVSTARADVSAGRALLVCAYDDPAKCAPVAGQAMSMKDFEARAASLPKDQAIRFICG